MEQTDAIALSSSNEETPEFLEEANQTLQNLLSAIRAKKEEMLASLSCSAVHPFEKLKQQYLSVDCKPITLKDINVPEDFCPNASFSCLTAINQKYTDHTYTAVRELTGNQDLLNNPHIVSPFTTLSSTVSGNDFIIDKKQVANHLQFLEFLKQIPLTELQQNPIEVSQKIVTQYIKSYS